MQKRLVGANVPLCCRGRGSPRGLVKFTIYLTDRVPAQWSGPAAAALLTDSPAPTTMVAVQGLASPRLLVEIAADAA